MNKEKELQPPYPTQAEILREIAKAFGVKSANKKLDDYVKTGDTHYYLCNEIIQDIIIRPLNSILSNKVIFLIEKNIKNLLKNYINIVKTISLLGFPREKSLPLLIEYFFSWTSANILREIISSISPAPADIIFLDSKESSIELVFSWIDKTFPDWEENHTKEEKDKYSKWRKGEYLPQITSISIMDISQENKTFILIAKIIDFFRKTDLGNKGVSDVRKYLWSARSDQQEVGFPLERSRQKYVKEKHGNYETQILKMLELLLKSDKNTSSAQKFKTKINIFKNVNNNLYKFWVNWYNARWHVLSGELKQAVIFYKKAIDSGVYAAGRYQLVILQEALIVAAKVPDRAFLKKLKNQMIVFDLLSEPYEKDNLDLETNNKHSRSKSHDVEDWEVVQWSQSFHNFFPKNKLFPSVKYNTSNRNSGFLCIDSSVYYEPDYKSPNKRIKIGGNKKVYPQLVWFIADHQRNKNTPQIISHLLEEGAKVDAYSESGETPILQALLNMAVYEYPDPPSDDTLFKIITSYSHKSMTLDRRSVKKKLLPLTCAVDTGKPEVVKKLLAMGADVDRTGTVDNLTALYRALIIIASIKNPKRLKNHLLEKVKCPTSDTLEALRRYSTSQLNPITSPRKLPRFLSAFEKNMQLLDIQSIYEIVTILLKYGANPNKAHSKANGYTPLMFAAELDEASLFKSMLKYGGDTKKFYIHPTTGEHVDCKKIALVYRAENVFELLSQLES